MPPLEKSPGNLTDAMDSASQNDKLAQAMSQDESKSRLHPFTQILTLKDVGSCLKLEEAAFPPHQRCSREKVSDPVSTHRNSMPLSARTSHSCSNPMDYRTLEMWSILFGMIPNTCGHPSVSSTPEPTLSSETACLVSATFDAARFSCLGLLQNAPSSTQLCSNYSHLSTRTS